MTETIEKKAPLTVVAPAQQALEPTNIDQAKALANDLMKADMLPKDFKGKAGNILVAMAVGAQTGIGWFQAMQGGAVIHGKFSWYGEWPLTLARRSDHWVEAGYSEGFIVKPDGYEGETIEHYDEAAGREVEIIGAYFQCQRFGGEPQRATFTIKEAMRAGLWGKKGKFGDSAWVTYPKWMLQARARARLLRYMFGDALAGCDIKEEILDVRPEPEAEPEGETGVERLEARLKARHESTAPGEFDEALRETVRKRIHGEDVVDADFAVTDDTPPIDPPASVSEDGHVGSGPVDTKTGDLFSAPAPTVEDAGKEDLMVRVHDAAKRAGKAWPAVQEVALSIKGAAIEKLSDLSVAELVKLAEALEAQAG